jgi:hypothetical protein
LIRQLIISTEKVSKQKKIKIICASLFLYILVPLPVRFNFSLDSLFLTVKADAPPLINLHSTYEFELIFYDKNNEIITYEQGKVSGIEPNESRIFNYSLIPNVKYRIIFTHIVNSTIYTRSNSTISPSI